MRYFGYSINKTRVHNAWNHILQLNDESLRDWRSVITACNRLGAQPLCTGAGEEHQVFMPAAASLPDVYAEMQTCSWCGALSIALKKCRGCGEAW